MRVTEDSEATIARRVAERAKVIVENEADSLLHDAVRFLDQWNATRDEPDASIAVSRRLLQNILASVKP